jgi:hypothetical protein
MFLEAIYFTYNFYKFMGVVNKVYNVYNYGRDSYYIVSKIGSYFAGRNKTQPDLTDSFLIEKKQVEDNWELIQLHR